MLDTMLTVTVYLVLTTAMRVKKQHGFSCLQGADSEALKAAQAEENRKSLYSIMSCMRDVRKRSNKTDNMFEPLRDTVSLLTKFSITMTDVVLKQLEEGPLAWKSLKKKMFQRYRLRQCSSNVQQIV